MQALHSYKPLPERRAKKPLERVHADITPILTESNAGHKYLSGFRDQYSGFVQVYPIVSRGEVMSTYLRFKRDHGEPRTLRTDGEYIKSELEEVLKADNTRHEFTCAYTSEQNADMESLWRVILQNTRMNLNQANLPHEWWHLAAKHAAIQLNCWPKKTPTTATEDQRKKKTKYLVPFTAFKGYKPRIELLHPFGCTAIVHKRKEDRKDPKLSRRATLGIYMGLSNKRKAFKVYLSDENRFIKTRNVRFIDDDFSQSHKLAEETEMVYNKYYHQTEEPATEEASNSASDSEASGGEESDSDEDTDSDEERNSTLAAEPPEEINPIVTEKQRQEQRRRLQNDEKTQEESLRNERKKQDEADLNQKTHSPPAENQEHPQYTSLSSNFEETTVATPFSETPEEEDWKRKANQPDSSQNDISPSKSPPAKVQTEKQRYPKRKRTKPKQFWKAQVYLAQHQRRTKDNTEEKKKKHAPRKNQTKQRSKPPIVHNPTEKSHLPFEPNTYQQAISCIENEEWKKAIEAELKNLKTNKTYKIVSKPQGANLVRPKWNFKKKVAADGSIEKYKARLVAKGFTQKWSVDYFETFAPVASHTTTRIFLAIATQLGTTTTQIDVKGAFLISKLDERIYLDIPEGFNLLEQHKPGQCLQLLKSLYGLKQAGRNWYLLLHKWLTKEMGYIESKVDQCLFTDATKSSFILIYVDDLLATFKEPHDEQDFKAKLHKKFPIGVYEDANWHLGINVQQLNGRLLLKQRPSIEAAVRRYGQENAHCTLTPTTSQHLEPKCPNEECLPESTPYRGIVGSTLYISGMTRPDISLAVNQVSRYVNEPTARHWNAAKRIVRYLKGTPDLCIEYKKQSQVTLEGYCDADFANDLEHRRSVTGYIFLMNGGPISWKSKLQRHTTISTCEAELEALFIATKEALYLRKLLLNFGVNLTNTPTVLHCDNKSAITVAHNPSNGRRTKHLSVKYHFLKDCIENKHIKLQYISSEENISDLLTKPMTGNRFVKLRDEIVRTDTRKH